MAVAVSAISVQHQQHQAYPNYQQLQPATKVLAASPVLVKKYEEEESAPAQYIFEYSVQDDHTGDVKSQMESRNGDRVEGHYSLVDADGYRRIVHYTADKHNGFQARVEREQIKGYVAPAAPVKVVSHQAPIQQINYAAPAIHYAQPQPALQAAKYVAPRLNVNYAPATKVLAPVVQQYAPVSRASLTPKIQYAAEIQRPSLHIAVPQQKLVKLRPSVQSYQGRGINQVSFQSPVANYYY